VGGNHEDGSAFLTSQYSWPRRKKRKEGKRGAGGGEGDMRSCQFSCPFADSIFRAIQVLKKLPGK